MLFDSGYYSSTLAADARKNQRLHSNAETERLSLFHTTVFCVNNRPTEFQIRTSEMHEQAENGIAAYWAYAQSKGSKIYQENKTIFAEKRIILD